MPAGPDPSSTGISVEIFLLIILILTNAFFASAEMAFVSANKNKIKLLMQGGDQRAAKLLKLLDKPTKFLSTIQVIITLSGFLASASVAVSLSGILGQYLQRLNIPYATPVAVIVATLGLVFVNLVFGELFPKRLAMLHSEKMALAMVGSVIFFSKLTAPFVWLLTTSVNLLIKITGQKEVDNSEEYSEDEIKSLLEVGQETGFIKETGKEMITSIFEFDDKLAYEVMTPRTDVYMININEPLEEYLDEMLEERFSRIPVYEKDTDNIIGILYMKDFILAAREKGFQNVVVRELIKKPFFVPESKKIDILFREMQAAKNHIAILIDEYGGVAGIVTIEDLVEEVMGNIDDEDDDYEAKIEKLDENTYMVDGQFYIDDINDELGLELESEEHETIGGLIIDYLGEIPEDGISQGDETDKVVEIGNCTFKIESVKDQRIEKIKLHIAPEKKDQASEEG